MEAPRVAAFARTIGADDPIHHSAEAAFARGYSGLRAPPTYVFAMRAQRAPVLPILEAIGLKAPSGQGFHAEQQFVFHAPVCAGMKLVFVDRIGELRRRQSGRLTFVTLETEVTADDGRPLVDCRYTAAVVDPTIPACAEQPSRPSTTAWPAEIARADLAVLTTERLAAYAEASGDHNLIHRDAVHARVVGLPGVIGHGMLTMGLMASFLARYMALEEVRGLDVRFHSPTQLGDTLSCALSPAGPGLALSASCGGRKVATGSAVTSA